jgi:formylglycine-generating enzyme required for sulfatase activity
MKKIIILIALIALTAFVTTAQTITDVKFEQVGKQLVITYNLDAPSGSQWQISVSASTDNGTTWGNNLSSVTGDVGNGIKPGPNKKITWDVLTERISLTGTISFKVKAEGNLLGEIEMIFVQGGTFTMGSNDGESDEKPIHSVTLSDFYIGKTEVTQKQWRDVMGNNPSYYTNCDNCPVEQVSWDDIQDFLQKLNQKTDKSYRLPTEAEWEYAAKGCNKSKGYTFSGSNSLGDVAWFNDNSGSKTHPVAQLQPNELGVYDMSGNVWEWCSDWYGDYVGYAQTNPKGPASGSSRVLRGGGWGGTLQFCRAASRNRINPDYRDSPVGFRLVSPK